VLAPQQLRDELFYFGPNGRIGSNVYHRAEIVSDHFNGRQQLDEGGTGALVDASAEVSEREGLRVQGCFDASLRERVSIREGRDPDLR
jgi:hypothetical protein